MKSVPVQQAVGMILCHDITKIVPGEFKGRAFQKGHIIREEDIPELLSLGKEHIYVWDNPEGYLHENEAAGRIARAVAGAGLRLTEPNQGKISFYAAQEGLLKVDKNLLAAVNSIEQVALATRRGNLRIGESDLVAGTRVIPLVIAAESIRQIEELCRIKKVLEVIPFKLSRVGMVTTGNEVFHGRIQDKFGPVVRGKVEQFGAKIIRQIIVPDSPERIAAGIRDLIAEGAEVVCVSGGMSVDPDDVTPAGIRLSGAETVTHGVPVIPGSMFLLAYLNQVPVMGLPGCVMYDRTTIFDLVLPRIFAGEKISRAELVNLGYNGLCLECPECRYPLCSFGAEA